jgi:hypothetical protein
MVLRTEKKNAITTMIVRGADRGRVVNHVLILTMPPSYGAANKFVA